MDIPFLAAILTWLSTTAATLGAWVAARLGYKIAVIALLSGVYVSIWAALAALLVGLKSLFPPLTGVPAVALSFLPDAGTVALAASTYLGTLVTLKSVTYWRLVLDRAATVGA